MQRKESRLAAFCGVASIVLMILCAIFITLVHLLPWSMRGDGGMGWIPAFITAADLSLVFLVLHIVLTIVRKVRRSLMVIFIAAYLGVIAISPLILWPGL
jgi:hypothetical protein